MALLPALLAAGCGHAPPEPSTLAQAAIDANTRGRRAFDRGDLDTAARQFDQALAADTAIDNADGIALNALSLARVEQALGRRAEAQARLDRLLAADASRLAPARRAEAQARKALLYLEAGDAAEALRAIDAARQACGDGCEAAAAILGIRAQLALRAGDTAAATAHAEAAQRAARARGQRAEEANALRLQGEARLARGEAGAALGLFDQALALDRELGAPRKIRLDLERLGQAHRALGETEAARRHYERALAVSEAAKDAAGSRELRALLDGLH